MEPEQRGISETKRDSRSFLLTWRDFFHGPKVPSEAFWELSWPYEHLAVSGHMVGRMGISLENWSYSSNQELEI